ncbi:uncharacterized protein LOC111036905 isoform X1 [Myzus persicae]|uniref:uncharacterized protein LOC111036905 isoform X1 n=2 Tax=Myzus persicae TaxID=13164 RepID=UPI000B9384BB|nr:uncharacterized protein LOC111036905 isoform X1 [Myzus persicae]
MMEISNFRKINKDRLSTFLEHLENKNLDTDEIFGKCLMILKTLLYTSSNFIPDSTLSTQSNIQAFLYSINFDVIEADHMIKLKSILDEGADLDIYARYIESILNKNNKSLNSILMTVWTQLGSNVLKLPIIIHEKTIKVNPLIFEKTILSAISLWEINNLIEVCSKSPLVFQTCSSIFNELLIKLNFTNKFMEFLNHFVNSVSSHCKNNNVDVVNIYPNKCRSILTLRDIKNKNATLVTEHDLNDEVKKLALSYPKESICLLSHFPDLYIPY